MLKTQNHLKTLSILTSLALSGCGYGFQFPNVNPKGMKFSTGVYYPCKIVDENAAKISCDPTPGKISDLPDGGYWFSASDAKKMRSSYLEAKKIFEERCN